MFVPSPTTFRPAKAKRVLNFFENVLRHPKLRGKPPFFLLRWQTEILSRIFGTVDEEGRRVVRRAYVEIPKKNGKSELAAGIALYMLIADDEPGAEVYSAATTKEQAAIVFKTAAAMVEASPMLKKKLRVIRSQKTIVKRNDPDSFYRAISADGGAQDGINPHCVIIDELHRWKSSLAAELYDVLTKGTIAREQPLVFEITTAGSTEDESPLAWSEHELTRLVNEGTLKDASFMGWIFAADKDADWTKPETWTQANPSLETNGGFLQLKTLQSEVDKAQVQKRRQAAFKRYHLGIWTSSDEEWMSGPVWAANAGQLRALVERPCYIGLDLSSVIDLTSLVLLFPDGDGTFDVLPFFWMAKDRVEEREQADHVPYSTWVEQGLIEAPEGDVIDYRAIRRKIEWALEMFEVRELAFDPAHARQLSIELTDDLGVKCVPVPPRYSHLSEPMKHTMACALQKKFRHAGHEILHWNMRCMRAKGNETDDIRPVKPKRFADSKRIDGAVALILAMSRAMFHQSSIYETRGIISA